MLSHAIEVLGWTLLHFVWQGAVVGALAATMLLSLRRQSANARYLTAVSALGLMLVLPLFTIAWIEHAPPGDISPIVTTRTITDMPRTRDDGTPAIDEPPIPVERIGIDFENPPPAEAAPLISVSELGQTLPDVPFEKQPAFNAESFFKPLIPWTVAGWLIGVGLLSLRLMGSWLSVQRLRRRASQPARETWQASLARLAERLRVTRPVKLVESSLVEVPAVVGWLRPVILLPATAMLGLTTDQVEALLAHELAHVRRHDYLVNLLQTVVETLLFYHPAVWWLSQRIRIEREHCCDDLAASVCGDRFDYVKALVAMEELRSLTPTLAVGASGGSLRDRIERMVSPADESRRSGQRCAGLAGLLTSAFVLGFLLLRIVSPTIIRATDDPFLRQHPYLKGVRFTSLKDRPFGSTTPDGLSSQRSTRKLEWGEIWREVDGQDEFLVSDWTNIGDEPLTFTDSDFNIVVANTARVFPPPSERQTGVTLAPQETRRFRLHWGRYVREGLWTKRENEVISESVFPDPPSSEFVTVRLDVANHGNGFPTLTSPARVLSGKGPTKWDRELGRVEAHLNLPDRLFARMQLDSSNDTGLFPREMPSDKQGRFIFHRLPPGHWTLTSRIQVAGEIVWLSELQREFDLAPGESKLVVWDEKVSEIVRKTEENSAFRKALHQLDAMRGQNGVEEIEAFGESLLKQFGDQPERAARIRFQLAHVFAQSNIREHFARVRKYGEPALKDERDPDRRATLHSYLASAAQVDASVSSFPERRRNSVKVWLEGYRELLSLKLPRVAPELPVVEKIGDVVGEEPAKRAEIEKRHAEQIEARRKADFVRMMVAHRQVFARQIVEVYRREPAADDELRRLATETLKNQRLVDALLSEGLDRRVGEAQPRIEWLDKDDKRTVSGLKVELVPSFQVQATERGLKGFVRIANQSPHDLTTKLAHEWHGGEWPPTGLYASVTPWLTLHDAPFRPAYLFGENDGKATEPLTIPAGQSSDISVRLDWPGTGSVPATPLIDPKHPGKYRVRWLLVFDSQGGSQYLVSHSATAQYAVAPPANAERDAMLLDLKRHLPKHWMANVTGERTIALSPGMYATFEDRPLVLLVYSDDKQPPQPSDLREEAQHEYLGQTKLGHAHLFVSMTFGKAAGINNVVRSMFDWPECVPFFKAFATGDAEQLEEQKAKAAKRVTAAENPSAGRGSPDPAPKPTEGLPNQGNDNQREKTKVGDLRSDPAAGSGDPRRAREHYAFVGEIVRDEDNEDGINNREQLQALVKRLDAVIDVEVDDNGHRVPRVGQISQKTTFLAVGRIPNLKEAKDDADKARIELIQKQLRELRDEARKNGVRVVNLSDFVKYATRKQMDRHIRAALDEITETGAFVDTPLSDVMTFFSDYHNIPVTLDTSAERLKDELITTTPQVFVLADALELILYRFGLSYCVDEGRLLIATPAEVERRGHKLPHAFADDLAKLKNADATIRWEALLLGGWDETDLASIPSVIRLLGHDDLVVQRFSARVLGVFGDADAEIGAARPGLEKLTKSKDKKAATTAWFILAMIGREDFSTLPLLLSGLNDGVLGASWPYLLDQFDPKVWRELAKAYPAASLRVRTALASSAGRYAEALPVALMALADPDDDVRRTALRRLYVHDKSAELADLLQARLTDSEFDIRVMAAGQLMSCGQSVNEAVELLLPELEQADKERASVAIRYFLQIHSPEAIRAVIDALDAPTRSKDTSRSKAAWRALMFVNFMSGRNHPSEVPWGPTRIGLRTRLSVVDPKSDRPPYTASLGEPIKLKLELKNISEQPVEYDAQQAAVNDSLTVFDDEMRPVKYIGPKVSTNGTKQVIKPGETHVLVEQLDLTAQYDLKQPGKYYIQWIQGSRAIAPDDAKTPFVPNSNVLSLEIQKAEGNGNQPAAKEGDLRSSEAAGSGDPRRAQATAPLKGQIRWIDQSKGKVWINLGQSDGVARPMRFQVREKADPKNGNQPPAVKGKIEVSRVIDGHTSEARIILDDQNNAVAKGDEIVQLFETTQPNDKPIEEPRKLPPPKGEIYDAAHPRSDRIKPKTESGTVSGAISGTRRDRDPKELDQFTGRVRLKTEKPLPDLEKVVVPAGKVLDESLVFSKEGGLANVFVYLLKPTFPIEPPPSDKPPKPFVLIAEGGKFWPHAAFVRVGRPVVFENRHTEQVNFRLGPVKNVSFNVLVKVQDHIKIQAFRYPEAFPFKLQSDIQPWMTSHLLTLDHPFAAVTDEEGRFTIDGLPPGDHEFRVWHERVGYLEKKLLVTLKAGEPTRNVLEYEPSRFELSEPDVLNWGQRQIDSVRNPNPRPRVPRAPIPKDDAKFESPDPRAGRESPYVDSRDSRGQVFKFHF